MTSARVLANMTSMNTSGSRKEKPAKRRTNDEKEIRLEASATSSGAARPSGPGCKAKFAKSCTIENIHDILDLVEDLDSNELDECLVVEPYPSDDSSDSSNDGENFGAKSIQRRKYGYIGPCPISPSSRAKKSR